MSIVKVIELISISEESIEDAIHKAVQEASKTLMNIDSVNVSNIKAHVNDQGITSYGVNCKVSFRLEGKT
ncbi:dodecin family protein [Algoriphagus vanfongensis]|uniref:dodecin family protein n=1 Tax=Algoriphagus vanfongensis TaxID=426371 RepID=UPI000407E838|nr:dodecin family protein [Algoriphagus vanfongensis]